MSAEIKYGTQPARQIIADRALVIGKLAEEIGVAEGHLYQSLQGRISPNDRVRHELPKILNLSLEKLFTADSLARITVEDRENLSYVRARQLADFAYGHMADDGGEVRGTSELGGKLMQPIIALAHVYAELARYEGRPEPIKPGPGKPRILTAQTDNDGTKG